MRFLLLLFLASCAAAPARPVYYCDGVETCPPEAFAHPGYTPAGAGLPEYRSTEEKSEVPRSPHGRVLPQTPETRRAPGLWAGDASARGGSDDDRDDDPETPRLFGIPLPTDTPEIAAASHACAQDMLFAALHTRQDIAKWPAPQRTCAVMRLYLLCAHDQSYHFEHAGGTLARQAQRLRTLALARRDAACTGTSMAGVSERFIDDVLNTYLRQTGRGR